MSSLSKRTSWLADVFPGLSLDTRGLGPARQRGASNA